MKLTPFGAVRALCLIAILALFSDCASKADQEAQRIQTFARDGLVQAQACAGAIAMKPQYARLYMKFPIGLENGKPRTPTAAQLTDGETVSDDDIARLLDWFAEDQSCNRESMNILGKIDPELVIIAARSAQENTSLVRDVVQNHLTYGAVTTRRMEIRARTRAAFATWTQRLRGRLDAMRQQEQIEHQQFMAQIGAVTEALATVALAAVTVLAQQQAITAQTQLNYARAHPTYVPAFQITTTNCQWIGSVWSCSSY